MNWEEEKNKTKTDNDLNSKRQCSMSKWARQIYPERSVLLTIAAEWNSRSGLNFFESWVRIYVSITRLFLKIVNKLIFSPSCSLVEEIPLKRNGASTPIRVSTRQICASGEWLYIYIVSLERERERDARACANKQTDFF